MNHLARISIVIATLAWAAHASAQNSVIPWQAFGAGFGLSTAVNSRLAMGLGYSFVGRSFAVNTVVESGFLVHPLARGSVVEVPEQNPLPATFALLQNYPNPFNPSTRIEYALPVQSHVTLTVYNVLGQLVATLVDEQSPAGRFTAVWEGTGANGIKVGSGVYFYAMTAQGVDGAVTFTNSGKMLLLK